MEGLEGLGEGEVLIEMYYGLAALLKKENEYMSSLKFARTHSQRAA